jgi:hypothetical protein
MKKNPIARTRDEMAQKDERGERGEKRKGKKEKMRYSKHIEVPRMTFLIPSERSR